MQLLVDISEYIGGAAILPGGYTATPGSPPVLDLRAAHVATGAILEVGSIVGATGTLNVKLQEAPTATGPFTDIPNAVFAQVTTVTGRQAIVFLRNYGFVQAVATLAGTTPNFSFMVEVLGQPKSSSGLGGYSRSPST